MGNSATHIAATGAPVAPFFRFPELQHSPRSLEYLAPTGTSPFSRPTSTRATSPCTSRSRWSIR
jgi:hypothetical protein